MKYKIGDKVRIIKGKHCKKEGYVIHDTTDLLGREVPEEGNEYHICKNPDDTGDYYGHILSENLELISTPQAHIRKVIVKVPTKEDFKKVVGQMRKDGINVSRGWENVVWTESYNNPEQEGFAVNVKENYGYGYCYWNYYNNELKYQDYKFLTTQEYLNKFKQSFEKVEYGKPISITDSPKSRTKIMAIIKNIFKSKEQKALSQYELTNGDGGLTEKGRNEFIDYLWETDKETRKDFIKKIVEQYEEDNKK